MAAHGGESRALSGLHAEAERARLAGRLADARHGFLELGASAQRHGDPELLVTAALRAGGLWVQEERDVVGRALVQSLWQRARELAPNGSLTEARLEVRLAAEAVYEGASTDAVVAAVERVTAFGDDASTAEALSLLHHVQLGPRHALDRCDLADEIIRLASRAGDALLALVGLCWRTVDLFLLGNGRARQSLTELRERAERAECEAIGFVGDVLEAMLLARSGQLDDAEKAATIAFDRGTAAGDPDAPACYGAVLAALRWWQGRADEVIPMVRALAVSPRLGLNDHVYVATDAAVSAMVGDSDGATEALAHLHGVGLSRIPESSTWLTTILLVIETAFLLGDEREANEASHLLQPYASLPVMPSLAVVCLGSAERGLGLAAAVTGDLDEAVDHLSAAITADRHLGSRPMATLTAHSLAMVLRARGVAGDRTRADELARKAEEQARRMSMKLPSTPEWLTVSERRGNGRSAMRASFERLPGGWRVETGAGAFVLGHCIGLAYLAELLSSPGQEVDVLTLASPTYILAETRSEPVLDESALRSYRRRARELSTIVKGRDESPTQMSDNRDELAALTAALRGATGLSGRLRTFPTVHERARTAVRKALVRAIASVAAVEPALGAHLSASIVTGSRCRYLPDDTWSMEVRT